MSDDQTCKSDSDCSYLYFCNDKNICEHDEIYPPQALMVIGFCILPLLIGVGNVGGLGGGITKVPVMMILMNYPQRVATYQAYCIQFGACISNAFLLFKQRHPNMDRPLIDYDLGLILVPIVMLGTTLGIYVNEFAPEIAANGLFIVFLISIIPFLYQKFLKLRKAEKSNTIRDRKSIFEERERFGTELHDTFDDLVPLQEDDMEVVEEKDEQIKRPLNQQQNVNNDQSSITTYTTQSEGENSKQQQPQAADELSPIEKIYAEEKKIFPLTKFLIICSSFVIVQLINFIIGTKSVNSIFGFDRCSAGFWVFLVLLPISTLALNYAAYFILNKEQKIKEENGYKYDENDLPFTQKNFIKVWVAGFSAGFLAGTLGAGGGLSLVTFLMALNLNSRVASATTGMNNLFIGLTSMISVLANDALPWVQVGLFTFLSLAGGLVFSKIIYHYVNKYNKTSMVVAFVIILVFINIGSNIGYIVKTEQEQGWGALTSTNSFCG